MSGSVWLNPPRPSRQRSGQSITRDQVAVAAVELADAGGIEAVTMRSVAEKLGISAMSLYWYVDSKSQIVELMFDLAFGEQSAPRGKDWRSVVRSFARGNLRRHQAHPWIKDAYGHQDEVPSPGQLKHLENAMRALTRVDPALTAAQLSSIYAVVNHVVAGYVSVPFPGLMSERGSDPVIRDYLVGVATDGAHPTMAAYLADYPVFMKDRFDDEIDVLVEGLAPYFE